MKRFKNILVGVDLSKGDRLVSRELAPPSREAVARALWLAKRNAASLLFLYALDVSARTQRLIEEEADADSMVVNNAQDVLSMLVEEAKGEGVAAESRIVFGKSWVQLIRQVLGRNHDLIIVGTRDQGRLKGMLLGSTGIKLLRKCPCPVWVTKPQPDAKLSSILVATDLSPVSDLAVDLGASMANLHEATLHVLHAVRYPVEAYLRQTGMRPNELAEYREQERTEAEQQLDAQLRRPPVITLAEKPYIHLVEGAPDFAILEHIETHKVELLVMGTVARTGIPGVLVGNTAERLLPEIPCSVLAVKPADFKSPITLE